MSLNSNKRKGRIPPNSKPGRPRIPLEKNHAVEGVYSNARFMHSAASLVGCVVHVQVKSGACYEGIFRTFSHQLDFVLEMVQKIDKKITSTAEISPAVNNLLTSMNSPDSVTEKLIFKLKDIVILSAVNLDLDYANKDNFTDSAISKFNGQVVEKELEPWDELCEEKDGMKTLEGEVDEANGWDANDMFRTNAEKYGVVSSYDSDLHGYTVPLEQKNTEEYKRQEAEASKLAQEIENSYTYRNRIMLENGDEEERHSAVIRPENNSSSSSNNNNNNNNNNNSNSSATRYGPPMRRKNIQPPKGIRSSPQVTSHSTPNRSHTSENQHNSAAPYYSHYKSNSSSSVSIPSSSSSTSSTSKSPTIPTTHSQQYTPPTRNQPEIQQPDTSERKVNGILEKEEQKPFIPEKSQPVPVKETIPSNVVPSTPVTAAKQNEKKKEVEKKGNNQKANREENLEALKKFSSEFKLAEENKEVLERKEAHQKNDPPPTNADNKPKLIDKKDNECEAEVEIDDQESNTGLKSPDSDTSASNPNKKYVLNPNAEVFTPRTLPIAMPTGPPPLQPRMHTPSPIVQVPQHQIMHSLPQPIFTTMTSPFVVSGTPVSMPITTPFGHAATVAPASRFRKGVPMLQQRPDMSPPVHVAAATGPPILAPAHPQLTVQYTPPPGVMPTQGPQPTMPYLQMYSVVGPRVMSPQPVAVVPTSHAASYGETHLPTPMYMPTHPGATVPMSAMPQGTPGSHSNASTPQSQTPTMHAPSPVHQPPVSHGTPAHTPTPTGHLGTVHTPQPVLYHGPMTSQHSLQHVGNTPHMSISHPHHSSFPAAPQPMVLMHQQHVPNHHHSSIPSSGPHALQGHHLHGQTPGNHLLQPGGIPTSATMVPVPPNASFVPHHQGFFAVGHLKHRDNQHENTYLYKHPYFTQDLNLYFKR